MFDWKVIDAALLMLWLLFMVLATLVALSQQFNFLLAGQRPEFIVLAGVFTLSLTRVGRYFGLAEWHVLTGFVPLLYTVWLSLVRERARATFMEAYIVAAVLFIPALVFFNLGRNVLYPFCKCCHKRRNSKKAKKPTENDLDKIKA